jgi:hypothetical protein
MGMEALRRHGSVSRVPHGRRIDRRFAGLKRCNLGVFARWRAEQDPLDLARGAATKA